MQLNKYIMLLFCLVTLIVGMPAGYCFDSYNPEGSGILCFESSPYEQKTNLITRKELSALWLYDLTLTAEEDTVYVTDMGITIAAHNCIPKTRDAMLMSKQNIKKIWVYVQYLKENQTPILTESGFIASNFPKYDAWRYRTVAQGELSSQQNMFLAEFKDVDIAVRPGEKVILSFFGRLDRNVPPGTKIESQDLIPIWRCSGKDMKFKNQSVSSEYIVQ